MFDFDNMSDEQIAKFILKQHGRLENRRHSYEPLWDVETKIFQPRRHDLLRTDQKGLQYGARIFDGHPQNAANKFTEGIIGYMVSNATPWLSFSTSRTEFMQLDEVKNYFQDGSEQILSSFSRSNFYDVNPQATKDGAVTGSPVLVPSEELVEGAVHYDAYHPGDIYIEDDGRDRIGVLHITRTLTAMTMVKLFDEDKLPQKVLNDVNNETGDPFTEYKCIYAMYQNIRPNPDSNRAEDKAYRTFWVLRDKPAEGFTKQILSMGGERYGPVDWRPGKEPGTSYGMSIAADALTEALITNKLGEKELVAVHGAVEPAMWVSKNLRGQVNLQPGGKTFFDKIEDRMEPVNANLNWPLSDAQMDRIHNTLDDKFHTRLFEMLTRGDLPGNITAFQISRMTGEQVIMLGSTLQSYKKYLAKAIDVQWDFETEAGRMPPIPAILQEETDGRIDIVFLGVLDQLQRSLLQSKGIIDGLAIAGEVARLDQNSLTKVNWNDTMEDALIAQGFPQKLIRSDDEMRAIQQADAEEVAKQQALEQGEMIAKALPSAGKSIEPNSPLSLLGVGNEE